MENPSIRFKYKYNDNPGPGTYTKMNNINDINIFKENLNMKKTVIVNKTIDEEEEKKKMTILENINREKSMGVPGVGTYNLDENDSINYNLKKKINSKLSYNSPFLASSGRFNYKDDKIDSPMYDTNYSKKKFNYMAFGKAQRFNYKNLKNISAGPGSYELNHDEQWNKRTFNKLFSS